jgi:hypothetical protein
MSVAMDQFKSATRYTHHWPPHEVAPPPTETLEARQSKYCALSCSGLRER